MPSASGSWTPKTRDLAAGARLMIDGAPVAWRVESASLELVPGQADLETMRVALTLAAPTRAAEGARVEYRDTNYAGRIGWHEVVLRGEGGIGLRDSTAPAVGATNELLDYPDDPMKTPPDVSVASAMIGLSGASKDGARGAPSAARSIFSWTPVDRVPAELTALVRDGTANPLALLGALALAAALGAMHGLGPGHGKTLVAAYLIGSRGTARHAALLGLTVTLTHTLGVYALGVVTLAAAAFIVPETLYPVISLLSGLVVVAVGVSLIRTRLLGASGNDHRHELPLSLTLPRKGGGDGHGHPHHHGMTTRCPHLASPTAVGEGPLVTTTLFLATSCGTTLSTRMGPMIGMIMSTRTPTIIGMSTPTGRTATRMTSRCGPAMR